VKERLLSYVKDYAKYARPVGYPLFYFVCLLLFASLTFPYDKLKQRIVASFNADQLATGGQQELQIDDVGGYWLSGLRLKGLTLLAAATEPGKPPTKIQIDDATVRYAIFPMLIGNSDMNFDAYAFGGEASGSYGVHGKDTSVEVTLEAIDIGKVEPVARLLGVPLEGKLGGKVRLTMPEQKASKGTGAVSLDIKDTVVGDGKAKIKDAVALPRLDVGTITFAAEAKDGVLKITKFVAGGRDLELQGDGRITMRELAIDSLCDVQVRFRINDAYRGKSDVTKSLFGAPGSSGPALFELADPKIKQSKRADGFYAWNMRGPLGRPEFIPAGSGAGGNAALPAFGPPKVGP
jgi:type II secretion system protein N